MSEKNRHKEIFVLDIRHPGTSLGLQVRQADGTVQAKPHSSWSRVHKNAPVIVKKLVKGNVHSKPSKSLQEWAKLGVMKLLHPGFFSQILWLPRYLYTRKCQVLVEGEIKQKHFSHWNVCGEYQPEINPQCGVQLCELGCVSARHMLFCLSGFKSKLQQREKSLETNRMAN